MYKKRIAVLNNQLSKIESYIPFLNKENQKISKSTVGWQLDHTLKVFNAVSEWTENSNTKDYKWTFNFWRSVLFPLCYIPRGKAKAPKYVLPPELIKTENIIEQIEMARTYIKNFEKLPKQAYFKHFIFGKLSKKQTLRFLEMHTNHHLKIVRDILKK